MMKLKNNAMILLFIMTSIPQLVVGGDVPHHGGKWQVEVSSAGNEYYQPLVPKDQVKPPTEEMLRVVKTVAPLGSKIERWDVKSQRLYFIRATVGFEKYNFLISTDGKLYELDFYNDSTRVEEEAGELIIKSTKKTVSLDDVPEATIVTLAKLFPDLSPDKQWLAETAVGARFIVVVGDLAFYARSDGQIQAAGLVDRGALNEIDPAVEAMKTDATAILTSAENSLNQFRERFNVKHQIHELMKKPLNPGQGFRFIVMGDSRSNYELWSDIIKHIDALDPKPAFVINTGDIVRHGYVDEYLEYYVPPLLETEIPYFIALGNHDDGDSGLAIEYQYLFGESSLNYFFDYGNTRFIFVDNVTRVQPYEKTLAWLEKVLASAPPGFGTIVSAHKPAATIERWAYHSWDEGNSQIFSDLMSRYKVSHVFFGHIHAYSTATFNGVDYTVSGGGGAGLHNRYGLLGSVHHYVICDVLADGSIKQQVVRFYENKSGSPSAQ